MNLNQCPMSTMRIEKHILIKLVKSSKKDFLSRNKEDKSA